METRTSGVNKYLEEHNVPQILTLMMESLCAERPADVVEHMQDWLSDFKAKRGGIFVARSGVNPTVMPDSRPEDAGVIEDHQAEQNRRRYSTGDRRRAVSSEPSSVIVPTSTSNWSSLLSKGPDKPAKTDPRIRARLEKCLMTNILFQSLEKDSLNVVCDAMVEMTFAPGAVIIRQNDEADNFYVIESGICHVLVQSSPEGEPKLTAKLEHGSCFGELALMYGKPRAATVKAVTDVRLWALDRDTYRRILLKTSLTKRRTYEDFLRRVPILESLTDYERLTIADAVKYCEFSMNEVIVSEGAPGQAFYMVMSGSVRITRTVHGKIQDLGMLGPRDFFGEVALLLNQNCVITATAVSHVSCIKLDRESFSRLLGPIEETLQRNMKSYPPLRLQQHPPLTS